MAIREGRDVCMELGDGGGSLPKCYLMEYDPWARATGKPCGICPALFLWLSWLITAVRFEPKVAKQTRPTSWSQQAHCLTHGNSSHDFSVTSHFKSSVKCPLAINVMQIFLCTHLLMRGPWKWQTLNKCRRLFIEQLYLLCTSLRPGTNIPEFGSCQSSHETNMLCDLA